jgi:acyl-CoA hydrolase
MVDLTSVVRPGDGIIWGQACAEPQTLVESLVAQRAHLSGVGAFLGSSYSGIVRPEHADHLRLSSYCGTGRNRALADAGVLEILPAPYSQLGALITTRKIPCDVVMVQVSPPNAKGEYSLGLGVEYLAPALKKARVIIAEVNDQVPWTWTEPLLRKEHFSLIVESSRPPVYLDFKPSEADQEIARYAAACIPEGATLECGIGSLPNAVLAALKGRRGLAYHSGLVCEGVLGLDLVSCV